MSHSGDDGTTSFLGKGRIWKDDARIRALGSLDEAMAALGLLRAFSDDSFINDICNKLQSTLVVILTEVATEKKNAKLHSRISESDLQWIEEKTNEIEHDLDKDTGFLIPGKSRLSALIDCARVTIRKAERECSHLSKKSIIYNPLLIAWMNRSSTLLFSLERWATQNTEIK